MPKWLSRALARIHRLAARRKVHFTLKALRELAALGLDEDDARHVLLAVTANDSVGRVLSSRTGEWMYVFKLRMFGTVLYLKVILRDDCVVISFHENYDDRKRDNDR